jgi:hypothetical protein
MMPAMRRWKVIASLGALALVAGCKDPPEPSRTAASASAKPRLPDAVPTASEELNLLLLDSETKKPIVGAPVVFVSQPRRRCRPPDCEPKRVETTTNGDGYLTMLSDAFNEINRLEVRGYHVAHVSPRAKRIGLRRRPDTAASASASATSSAAVAPAPAKASAAP